MPQIKDLLVHVEIETALKKRKCHRNSKHSIGGGESCLVVHGGPHNSGRNYCRECATPILAKAQQHLTQIRNELGA